MRTPLESDDEAAVREWAFACGWKVIKVGKNGNPDRVFIRDGLHVWIEMKRRRLGRTAVLQERQLRDLREHGAVAHLCAGKVAAIATLEAEWLAHVARKTEGL